MLDGCIKFKDKKQKNKLDNKPDIKSDNNPDIKPSDR